MIKEPSEALHKKRYGQFFSGKKVAEMLFSLLPKDRKWNTIVDPMVGIGDMLFPVMNSKSKASTILGVEIDKAVATDCRVRFPKATILSGDAFITPELITSEGWDLVITNPPYVRYQLLDNSDETMPSAHKIRKNLVNQISAINYLSKKEKSLFLSLANKYSGLSDMAVPAWILCAALVKQGGYLAIVVPETWLNRNYAAPIQYLLMKLFHIETISKDIDGNWFPDAQVKTSLVVAKRVEHRDLLEAATDFTRIIESNKSYTVSTLTLFPQLSGSKDVRKIAEVFDIPFFYNRIELPHELKAIVKKENVDYISLLEMGIECGQGLRTGANNFFYVTILQKPNEVIHVQSRSWDHGGKEYCFSQADVLLTLQNRGEIDGLVVRSENLTTAVLYPQGSVDGELKDYIRNAERYRDAKGRHFKEYSAVKTNEKKNGKVIIREWYRLPKMANRHLPNLCLTRISANIAECLYICQSDIQPIAVDANMVTLWGRNERNIRIVFAILNSTWSKLSLELICTVMGGGALKIEASHLKSLLLPKLPECKLDLLEKAGTSLMSCGKMTQRIQDDIDSIIGSIFENDMITEQMHQLLMQKYKERSTRS